MKNITPNDEESIINAYSVLVISHKQTEIISIKKLLEASGYGVLSCEDTECAVDMLGNNNIKTVLVNSGISSPSCDEFVDIIISAKPDIPLILTDVMSISDSGMVLRSVRKGIFDFIISAYDSEQLLISVDRAVHHYNRGKAKIAGGLPTTDEQLDLENEVEQQAIYIKKRTGDEK